MEFRGLGFPKTCLQHPHVSENKVDHTAPAGSQTANGKSADERNSALPTDVAFDVLMICDMIAWHFSRNR